VTKATYIVTWLMVASFVAVGCGTRTGLLVDVNDGAAAMGPAGNAGDGAAGMGPAGDIDGRVMVDCDANVRAVVFRGLWQIEIVGSEAGFPQRIIVCGSDGADGAHQGQLGASFPVDGDEWSLSIEHNDGSAWISSSLRQMPVTVLGASDAWRVESEDGVDDDYNDLVLLITRE